MSSFGLEGQALPIGEAVPPGALVVNATSLGMTGQPPLDLDCRRCRTTRSCTTSSMRRWKTGLLAAARARGLATIDGLDMLIGQAAVAFERSFGAAPPREGTAELRKILLG